MNQTNHQQSNQEIHQQLKQGRWRKWQRKLRWLPAIVWMGVIFYLSSKTGDELNTVLPFIQQYFPFIQDFNWGHYVSYFILAMAVDYGFGASARSWRTKLYIVLICTVYGVTDEIHQYFVGGRMMDIYDVRNDAIGAAVWVLLAKVPFVETIWKKLSYDR
ncbi:VanZ family protein [Paenibacillus septentrionalis]|uniref:VanZ family protein n=1 Tax=Paenibacillus septentrionalis TaxID=429342 RepID=A0ABW1V0S9_9BACL